MRKWALGTFAGVSPSLTTGISSHPPAPGPPAERRSTRSSSPSVRSSSARARVRSSPVQYPCRPASGSSQQLAQSTASM
eukprot:6837245-Pyramimonas_sp.AAC.1